MDKLIIPRDLILQKLKTKAPDLHKKIFNDRKMTADFFKLCDCYNDLDQIIRMMRGR